MRENNTAATPTTRNPWLEAHERFLRRGRTQTIKLLFAGDSLTQNWQHHTDLWDREFSGYKPSNFGFGGDRTEHLLWRFRNGELDALSPRLIVLLIGTNNIHLNTPEQIHEGVSLILDEIRHRCPDSRVLHLAIFPKDEADSPLRENVRATNALIQGLADGERVTFLDIGDCFLEADGSIARTVMHDLVHLTREGYERWAKNLREPLARLMKAAL